MSADLGGPRRRDHAALIGEKEKKLASLTATIEAKLTRQGDIGVEVECMMGLVNETQVHRSSKATLPGRAPRCSRTKARRTPQVSKVSAQPGVQLQLVRRGACSLERSMPL